jgi:hypothetical protein
MNAYAWALRMHCARDMGKCTSVSASHSGYVFEFEGRVTASNLIMNGHLQAKCFNNLRDSELAKTYLLTRAATRTGGRSARIGASVGRRPIG